MFTSPLTKLSFTSKLSVISVVVLVAGIFVAVIGSQQSHEERSRASSTNLIQNSGFENTGSSWLLPWYFHTQSGASGNIDHDPVPHDGAYSAEIDISQSNATNPWYVQLYQSNLALYAGHSYTVGFWAKANTSRTIQFTVQQDVSPYTVYYIKDVSITSSWQYYSFAYTQNTSLTNAHLAFNVAQSTGDVWIDTVSMVDNGVPATATPTQTQSVVKFNLKNASTNTYLLTINNGDTINLATLPSCLNIVAQTNPSTVGSVRFGYDGNASFENEQTPPYWLEDSSGVPICFQFTLGTHTITATPYSGANESGTKGTALTISFTVINQAPTATPKPTNTPTPQPTSTPVPTATPTPPVGCFYQKPVCTLMCSLTDPNCCPAVLVCPTSTPYPTMTPQPTYTPYPTVPQPTETPAPTSTPYPTSTPVPGDTQLALTVFLHGIGLAGDSANPGSQGNMNPNHPQRSVSVDIYNSQNQLVVGSKTGTVAFNATAGDFTGTIDVGSLPSGIYTVKVKSDQYLRASIPGIQTISASSINNLPAVTLITGDINNDNAINILDYNLLMGCYSDLLPPVSCDPSVQPMADLTDDGAVNQFDYNLFIRELTNIGGQ